MATATHNGRPIVEQRQTKLELYVTAKEAYDMWQADPEGVKVLDVRTPEEWVFTGHAPMATLIPFAFMAYVWDKDKQGFTWSLNPDFLDRVKERFSPEDTVLITCRSGGRAAMAINMMAAAGYTKAYNILDGMEGARVDRPRQCLRRHAPQERLGDVRAAVDLRPRPRRHGDPQARRGRGAPPWQLRGLSARAWRVPSRRTYRREGPPPRGIPCRSPRS